MFSIIYRTNKIRLLLSLTILIMLAILVILSRPLSAHAYVDNMDTNPPSRASNNIAQTECVPRPMSWGVGVSIEIKLFDENGVFRGYASNYTFNINAKKNGVIRVGAAPNPNGPTTTGQSFFNGQFTMGGAGQGNGPSNVSGCQPGIGGFERHPYVIDSEFYNEGNNDPLHGADAVMLDCLYQEGQTTSFMVSGARVNQPGWEDGEFINPFNTNQNRNEWLLSSNTDLNDAVIPVTFEYHKHAPRPQGSLNVRKHLLSSPSQLVPANNPVASGSVSLTGNGLGPIVQTGQQAYYSPLPATNQPYTITMGPVTGFKLKKYAYSGANGSTPIADINSNLFDGIYLPGGGTAFVDLYYDVGPPQSYYPWLQTQKGDVSTQGSITGQRLGSGDVNSEPLGARHSDATNRYLPASTQGIASQPNPESSYVVASARGGKNFCSSNLYVLGTDQVSRASVCDISSYLSTVIKFEDMKSALNNAWNNNGAGSTAKCSPYNTAKITTYVNPDLSLGKIGCTGIQQVTGNYTMFPASTIGNGVATFSISGKGTVWVKGNLTLKSNIIYNYGNVSALQDLPNLVIFVEGNVDIDATVTQIDAAIIATGTINSCTQYKTTTPTCSQPLVVNGLWASEGIADNGNSSVLTPISFGRRYFNLTNPNNSPAEALFLTGQTIVSPPPGLDRRDGDIDSQLQINAGELPPRLK